VARRLLPTLRAVAQIEPLGGHFHKERQMPIGWILLIVLVILLLGAVPTWPYSRNWGYYPSGGIFLLVIIVLILVFMGVIPR
jgi:hypothetical protein